ncbi:hypothetical protein BDQ17DRAFT_1386620 [Cyathus striatus]|nr:hypothetical protein BDQ17DRAFT_1386620 [Cyathus striatus]
MSSDQPPPILNIHTPTSSFAIVHSFTQDSLTSLFDKLSRKAHSDYHGELVGPGWLKYEYNDTVWNLDDESDYTIFAWRLKQASNDPQVQYLDLHASTSSASIRSIPPPPPPTSVTPTLHLRNPTKSLPQSPDYLNPSFYLFRPSQAHDHPRTSSRASARSGKAKPGGKGKKADGEEVDGVPKFKKEFEKFHAENGVRTVIGSIGPVNNVRMLLKSGYRYVYISRKFAMEHGFIPEDATPGHYGYSGLVNIGSWPITLVPSATQPNSRPNQQRQLGQHHSQSQQYLDPNHLATPQVYSRSPSPATSRHTASSSLSVLDAGPASESITNVQSRKARKIKNDKDRPELTPGGRKIVYMNVYLSEEPHFDVVLGRSFFEKRAVKISNTDPTDVICLDTGEKVECELVILKDGKGQIVTVT